MPPVNIHLSIAEAVAQALGAPPELESHEGDYLLGCCAPDIRYLTKQPREHTHFFALDNLGPQDSLRAMFAAHPSLAAGRQLDRRTLAFMAGYISHLATDEVWICEVFRPCFGPGSPWAQEPWVQALDRALQAELDRRERRDPGLAQERQALLRAATSRVAVPFLAVEDLERWRDQTCRAVVREATWESLERFLEVFLRNVLRADGPQLDRFLETLPQSLQRTLDYVSEERLAAFKAMSINRTAALLREYLS
ncbi:MAG: zinc dependent phospholipase C family protein [Chloroflexi bacterium]|nr:zinc dependent phospholipase C family protein [Chloroflexota bacterium]